MKRELILWIWSELNKLFSESSKKRLERKIVQYKNRLVKNPYHLNLYLRLGDLLLKQNRPQAAAEYYRTAAGLLAQGYHSREVTVELIKIYKKILALSPLDDQTCKDLGEEYSRIGQHKKAYNLYFSVAENLYRQGFYEKALKLYQSALVFAPDSTIICSRCADIYYRLGRSGGPRKPEQETVV